ncbi:Glycosyl hydrolases family 43 [Arthrobacter sp. UNCCL28]|nr:Glycosyl hydrolases family 43 [Arthrobacter sp. UNCCL28]
MTGIALSPARELWRGSGGAHVEGPHVYTRNGWWYLLTAEGGTAAGHMITVARAEAIGGPYSPCPANPILTHRSTSHPVQAVGHGDLFELHDGSWAMVHLGTRPRGSFPKWHTNGRETFIVGIDWVEDWPVVVEDRFTEPEIDTSFEDRFLEGRLHPRWLAPGVNPSSFATPGENGLTLLAGRQPANARALRLLAVRATDLEWTASVQGIGDLALTVRIDDLHQATVQRVGGRVAARVVIGPTDQDLAVLDAVSESSALTIRSVPYDSPAGQRKGPDRLVLGVGAGADFQELAAIDGRYLSTEVAGGFTGRVVGMEALGSNAVISRFTYSSP